MTAAPIFSYLFSTWAVKVAELILLPLRNSRPLERRYEIEEQDDKSFDLFIIARKKILMLVIHGFRV